jgi:hypothetical protein
MQNQIFNFSRFTSALKESDEDLLKDLDSLGYEIKFDWATIEKAMKGMLDLKGYVKIEWSKEKLFTEEDSTTTRDGENVYMLNFQYPKDLFEVKVDETSFIRDFIEDLKGYDASNDNSDEVWTIGELEKAFDDVDVEYAFKDRVVYNRAKVSFSIEEDTRLGSDEFGISLTIVKEKNPELENPQKAIDNILLDLKFVLF